MAQKNPATDLVIERVCSRKDILSETTMEWLMVKRSMCEILSKVSELTRGENPHHIHDISIGLVDYIDSKMNESITEDCLSSY